MVLSLATAKPEETAVRILEHFGLADRFAVLAGATYEPGRRTKDEVITHALHELGIEPGAHVVMVGDRDHDVHGAAVHGIDTIGVLWGYGGAAELTAAGAWSLAATPADVVALVTSGRRVDAISAYATSSVAYRRSPGSLSATRRCVATDSERLA